MIVGQSVAERRSATLMDEGVVHLSSAMQSALRLADTEWLNSFDFCVQYVMRPATRVRLRLDEEARVSEACFYSEDTWKWGLRKLHIFGPVRMTNEECRNCCMKGMPRWPLLPAWDPRMSNAGLVHGIAGRAES